MCVTIIETCCYQHYVSYSLLRTYIILLIVGVNAKQEQAAIWVLDYVVIYVNAGFEVHAKTCSGGSVEGNCPARR